MVHLFLYVIILWKNKPQCDEFNSTIGRYDALQRFWGAIKSLSLNASVLFFSKYDQVSIHQKTLTTVLLNLCLDDTGLFKAIPLFFQGAQNMIPQLPVRQSAGGVAFFDDCHLQAAVRSFLDIKSDDGIVFAQQGEDIPMVPVFEVIFKIKQSGHQLRLLFCFWCHSLTVNRI